MSNYEQIEKRHKDKVIIFNGFNGIEIHNLKNLDEESLKKKEEWYDKAENFLFFSNNALTENVWLRKSFLRIYVAIGVLILAVFFFHFGTIFIKESFFPLVLIICGAVGLVEKESHRMGYFDGYHSGYQEGINKALNLNEEDIEMIKKQVEKERELDIDIKHEAKLDARRTGMTSKGR